MAPSKSVTTCIVAIWCHTLISTKGSIFTGVNESFPKPSLKISSSAKKKVKRGVAEQPQQKVVESSRYI